MILRIIGSDYGWLGVLLAAVVCAVILNPGFPAFPTTAMLLKGGFVIFPV